MKSLLFYTDEALLPELVRTLTRRHRLRLNDGDARRGTASFIPDPDDATRKSQARVTFATSIHDAAEALSHAHFDAVVADNRRVSEGGAARTTPRPAPRSPFNETRTGRLLTRLVSGRPPETRLRPGRVIVILDPGEGVEQEAYELGRWRAAGFVVHPFKDQALMRAVHRLVGHDNEAGRRSALCLAGGGVEGLLYELGVVRALAERMRTRGVLEFDVYCGISAGAFLASFLAAGLDPTEVLRAINGESAVLPPIGPGVLFDPYPAEYLRRALTLPGLLPALARGGPAEFYAHLMRAFPEGLFKGEALERYLRAALAGAGIADRFDAMRHELYIGATDQDVTEHVVFGEAGRTHVPVSRAVRASAGLPPFYAPCRVGDRWYVDGGVTRTTGMKVAIEHGARLVVAVDPLIPVDARDEPGYVRARGGYFGTLQAIKGLTHSRFSQAFEGMVDQYPDVVFVLFKPDAECRRAMSGSPMKLRIRQEIEGLAYRTASRQIDGEIDRMRAEFARFGFILR
jgi:predicted acylesterase/phospholipase RssA